jgi:hypothetical protein
MMSITAVALVEATEKIYANGRVEIVDVDGARQAKEVWLMVKPWRSDTPLCALYAPWRDVFKAGASSMQLSDLEALGRGMLTCIWAHYLDGLVIVLSGRKTCI